MAACLLHVKTYIQGHYLPSDRELKILKNPVNRKILEALRSKYPIGMTAKDVVESTGQPLTTIHSQLDELKNESFTKELEEKRRGEGRRPSSVHIIEDSGSVRLTASSYRLAPGNVKFSNVFVNGLEKIANREDEERLHNDLILYISKILRLTTESQDEAVRKMAPDTSKKMCCFNCGINHEARDFIRAMLLRLIDRLEIKDGFIKLLRERGLVTEEAFTSMMETSSCLTKEEERIETTKQETIQVTKPETISVETQQKPQQQPRVEPATILVRIISIQKDVPSESVPFLAIDKNARFFTGRIDRALVRDEMTGDTMIRCVTEQLIDDEEYGQYIGVTVNDSVEIISDDPSFLKIAQLESRIEDIDLTRRAYVIKGVVLFPVDSDPETKTYRVPIGDDSGSMTLTDNKEGFVSNLNLGDTVRIIGASVYADHLELMFGGIIEKTGEINVDSPSMEKLEWVKQIYPPKKIITIGQSQIVPQALKVTLHRMHLSDDFTRLFLTIDNIGAEKDASFHNTNLRLIQGKKQFECLYSSDHTFRNVKRTIPAGVEETGVLIFEPLSESQDPIRFRLVINAGLGGYLFDFDEIDITK